MKQLWVVGSLNQDLVVECPHFPLPGETILGLGYSEIPGGKGGNQAVALARLGGRPRLVAALGDDSRGQAYRQLLRRERVDDEFVFTLAGQQTGLALIEVSSGENRIVVVPGANGALTPDHVREAMDQVQPGDIVLFQLEIPFETVVQAVAIARAKGAVVVLDPAPARHFPPEFLRMVDYLTPNQTEARVVAGLPTDLGDGESPLEAARRLLLLGARTVVQKAGAAGSYVVTSEQEVFRSAFSAQVVDTIGAGDAFNAGFAMALALGKTPSEAIAFGNAAGALSTRAAGAQAGLRNRAEWESMLN